MLIGDNELMQVLRDWNADVTVQDTNGMTALESAARDGHDRIRLPLQHHQAPLSNDDAGDRTAPEQDVETQAPDTKPVTPRPERASGLEERRRELRARFSGLPHGACDPEMLRAASEGDLDSLVILMDVAVGFDIDRGFHRKSHEWQTLLQAASQNGHNLVVKALLAAGAAVDPFVGFGTPLFLASENGHKQVVRTLVAAGANVNTPGRRSTPLQVASKRGDNEIVHILLDAGAIVDGFRFGVTSLVNEVAQTIYERHLAAEAHIDADRGRRTAWVRASFEAWKDGVNLSVGGGMTPLQLASQQGHGDIVTTLVAAGADVEEVREGKTPLRIALDGGHKDIAATLLSAGARSGAARVAYVARQQLGIKRNGKSHDSTAL